MPKNAIIDLKIESVCIIQPDSNININKDKMMHDLLFMLKFNFNWPTHMLQKYN